MLAVHAANAALSGTSEAAFKSNLGYSGEQWDASLRMQNLRARAYDPVNGRFVGLDPFAGNMQDPQSLHKYAYVHGDPIQGVDPTGKSLAMSMAMPTIALSANVMYSSFVVRAAIGALIGLVDTMYSIYYLDPLRHAFLRMADQLRSMGDPRANDIYDIGKEIQYEMGMRILNNTIARPLFWSQLGIVFAAASVSWSAYTLSQNINKWQRKGTKIVFETIRSKIASMPVADRIFFEATTGLTSSTEIHYDADEIEVAKDVVRLRIDPAQQVHNLTNLLAAVNNRNGNQAIRNALELYVFADRYGDIAITPPPTWLP